MSNIVAVLIVRCTHTGVYADGRPNRASVSIYDLDEITIQKNRTRYVPVPVDSSVDIPMSSRTFVSWHNGSIFKLTRAGLITTEIILQLRDRDHCGGATGTGQGLRPAVLNAERVGGVLRLVLPDNIIPTQLDSIGFLEGEPVKVTGLTGAFRELNASYEITSVAPGFGLAGADTGSYLITVSSPGPDLPAATLAGVNLCLTEGRVVTQFNSGGDVGGLGTNVFGYIGGQLFPGLTGGGGGSVAVLDEGIVVDPAVTAINFVGAGVTASSTGPGTVDITIPGGGGGGDTETFTAGSAITVGDLVTIDSSGLAVRADSSISGSLWEVVGVSTQTVLGGASVVVITHTGALANIRFGVAPLAASNGRSVFLNTVSGQATLTPPTSSGNTIFTVGTLQGANGVSLTPAVVFRPQLIAQRY